ncbi:MAG: hypothetical protein AB1483_10450 [Candidatus Zixiibacteriota bacterium]
MGTKARRVSRNNKGGALLITIFLMAMLAIAALTAVDTAQTDIELSFNQLHADQAFYVAEAGLKRALVELISYNSWDDGYAGVSFESGAYSVAVAHSDIDSLIIDTVILRSTATVQDAHANLEAVVVPRLWYPFQYAVFGKDSIDMINSINTDSYNSDSGTYAGTVANTDGDIASNGTIDLVNTATIGGDASSAVAGGVDVCATCTVFGDVESGIDPYDLPIVPDSEYVWAHDNNSAPGGLSGSFSYDGATHELTLANNAVATLSGGTYYFSDINLGSTSDFMVASGEVVRIYMSGDLVVSSSALVNPTEPPASLQIFSKGDLVAIGMSIEITAAFYGPGTDVIINNASNFYGSIIAKSVWMEDAAQVHYDRALMEKPMGTTGEMIMIAWKEI